MRKSHDIYVIRKSCPPSSGGWGTFRRHFVEYSTQVNGNDVTFQMSITTALCTLVLFKRNLCKIELFSIEWCMLHASTLKGFARNELKKNGGVSSILQVSCIVC